MSFVIWLLSVLHDHDNETTDEEDVITTVPIEKLPTTSPKENDVTEPDDDVTKTDDDVTEPDDENKEAEFITLVPTLVSTLPIEPYTRITKSPGVMRSDITTVPVVRNQATTIGYRHLVRKFVFWSTVIK